MQILVIGESLARAEALRRLSDAGRVRAESVATAAEALEQLELYEYAVIVTAPMLPDMSGEELIRRVRAEDSNVALIVIGALSAPRMLVGLLDAGADDIVSPAVTADELLARIRAVMRRYMGYTRSVLRAGTAELDMHARSLSVDGMPVPLTAKEYSLLEVLFLRKGTALKKEALITHLYGTSDGPDLKTIDVLVCRIRKKLADVGLADLVCTVRGAGYLLRAPAELSPARPAPAEAAPAFALSIMAGAPDGGLERMEVPA